MKVGVAIADPARTVHRMSGLSIRVKVTLAFAVVMALVLGGTGLFLYLRLGSELDH